MKTITTIGLLTLWGALTFTSGCGKQEDAVSPTENDTPAVAPATTATAPSPGPAEVQKQVEAAKAAEAAKIAEAARAEAVRRQGEAERLAAEKTAADKAAQMAATAAQEKTRIETLIATVKNLIGEKKYAEALQMLAELSNSQLSPEQQTLVDGLKKTAEQQATQAVTDKATSGATRAIGDALGGKK